MSPRIDQNVLLYGLDSGGVPRPLLVDSLGQAGQTPLAWIRLTMNAAQAVLNNTDTALAFDTVSGSYNWTPLPTAPISNIILPYTGIFRVSCYDLDWGDNAITVGTGRRAVGRQFNGVGASFRMAQNMLGFGGTGANKSVQSFGFVKYLTANEYMQIIVNHTAAATLNVAMVECWIEYIQFGTQTFVGVN